MTRVTETQLLRDNILNINRRRDQIYRLNREIDTGLKVQEPSDSSVSATIEEYRRTLDKLATFQNRTASVKSFLTYQDDNLSQVGDILNRAREIAAQAANETNSAETRAQMAEEVFQIRDHLVSLANAKYQNKYIWGGAQDTDPPYDPQTYTNPATGGASQRYVWDNLAGRNISRTINISENLTIGVDTQGNQVFDNAIQGLERLGRALAGYETLPASGAPDGTGNAYTFPTDYSRQTQDIQAAIDLLDQARTNDIEPQRVELGGKLRRIETAEALLELTETNAQEALDKLQNADIAESASALTQAQTVLQASLTVTARVMNMSILDFL